MSTEARIQRTEFACPEDGEPFKTMEGFLIHREDEHGNDRFLSALEVESVED